jgi:ribosomal protein S27AE
MKNVTTILPMSPMPIDIENDWRETNRPCPNCGDVRLWQADWEESTEDEGFYIQGTIRECGECGYRLYA